VRRRSTVRAPNPDPCNGLHGNLVLGVLLQSPRNVTDFNAFGAFKTSKFRYILGWCGFRKILGETKSDRMLEECVRNQVCEPGGMASEDRTYGRRMLLAKEKSNYEEYLTVKSR
jgi:hypothetical protein